MKRILIMLIASITILTVSGCAANDEITTKEFNADSSELYVQMFTDGEQTEAVEELYEDYVASYEGFEGDELYESISGMYNGLNDGNATKYQLDTMTLLNDIN